MTKEEKANGTHGYAVTIAFRIGYLASEDRTIDIAGTASAVRRKAMMKKSALRVIEIKPITQEAWFRAYGDKRIRM